MWRQKVEKGISTMSCFPWERGCLLWSRHPTLQQCQHSLVWTGSQVRWFQQDSDFRLLQYRRGLLSIEWGENGGRVGHITYALAGSRKQTFSISFKLHRKILRCSLLQRHDTLCRNEAGHACQEPWGGYSLPFTEALLLHLPGWPELLPVFTETRRCVKAPWQRQRSAQAAAGRCGVSPWSRGQAGTRTHTHTDT